MSLPMDMTRAKRRLRDSAKLTMHEILLRSPAGVSSILLLKLGGEVNCYKAIFI